MRILLPLYFLTHQNKWRIDSEYHLFLKNGPNPLLLTGIASEITLHRILPIILSSFIGTYTPKKTPPSCTLQTTMFSTEFPYKKIPDLRLHYFKTQFLGAFLWKCLGKACLTLSASPVFVNAAKRQSIWSHEKKIPLTVILQTTSKEKKHSVNQRKHHSYSYSKIFTLNFKMYSSISQATSTPYW